MVSARLLFTSSTVYYDVRCVEFVSTPTDQTGSSTIVTSHLADLPGSVPLERTVHAHKRHLLMHFIFLLLELPSQTISRDPFQSVPRLSILCCVDETQAVNGSDRNGSTGSKSTWAGVGRVPGSPGVARSTRLRWMAGCKSVRSSLSVARLLRRCVMS